MSNVRYHVVRRGTSLVLAATLATGMVPAIALAQDDGDGDDGGNDGGNGGSTPGGGNTEGSGDAGGSTKDDGTVE